MAEDLSEIQAMIRGEVAQPCGKEDGKGLPCGLAAGHAGAPRHCRLAIPGEAPYLEGAGNSVITWTEGPSVRKVK